MPQGGPTFNLNYATAILISPSPSIPPVITSPRCTGPTPSGVPVMMMMSPGFNAIECDQIEMMSATGQISFEISESCLTTPSTASQMRPAAAAEACDRRQVDNPAISVLDHRTGRGSQCWKIDPVVTNEGSTRCSLTAKRRNQDQPIPCNGLICAESNPLQGPAVVPSIEPGLAIDFPDFEGP
jgi:hypothetical protein